MSCLKWYKYIWNINYNQSKYNNKKTWIKMIKINHSNYLDNRSCNFSDLRQQQECKRIDNIKVKDVFYHQMIVLQACIK